MATFPYAYTKDANGVLGMGNQLTMAQVEAKTTVKKLNPEFWRRFKALMEYAATQGVPLGVGTGWRIQPSPPPPGFAAPGNSNHEGFPADGVTGGAVAIDAVPAPSMPWMERNAKAYGLRTFYQPSTSGYLGKNEPWHVQPAEIPAGRAKRTTPWKLNTFSLPTSGPPPAPTPPPTPTWATDLMNKMPVLTPGGVGVPVKRMQHFLALSGHMSPTNTANFDGRFGPGTTTALNSFLASGGKPQNSRCDAMVWNWFMEADSGIPTLKKGATGMDVKRMQRLLSANNFMDPANQANFDGQFGSGTETALKKMQSMRHLTADGVCGQASWTSLLNG